MISILVTHNRLRPWALWLALCVAWFAALAPTLQHALVLLQVVAPASMEICSAQGSRATPSQDGYSEPESENGSETTPSHCWLCLHHTDRVSLASSDLPLRFLALGAELLVSVLQTTPVFRKCGFTPPPRGPPCSFELRNA